MVRLSDGLGEVRASLPSQHSSPVGAKQIDRRVIRIMMEGMVATEPTPDSLSGRYGLVLSDLHLFSIRSVGEECLASIRDQLAGARVIVLNGDTFDFRWSTIGTEEHTIAAALDWLRAFVADHPQADVHFILGNHDCLAAFTFRLDSLASGLPRFHWHETVLQLGGNLFVHGDCAHRPMDAAGLDHYRSLWRHDKPRHRLLGHGYRVADRLGITWLAHRSHFTRAKTLARLTWYLDCTNSSWRGATRDCYFGHTHLPMRDCEWDGVRFHNTGSAIQGSPFSPLRFALPAPPIPPAGK
ncbi:MAG: metallophosphoesterase [Luteolibacter sp.]